MTERDTLVTLSGITRSYGSTAALCDVNLSLPVGITVLLGRNGAGKSTLCRILTGLDQDFTGAVIREDGPVSTRAQWRAHHAKTGWLPQHLSAPGSMTLTQYLRYAGWLKGLDRRQLADAIPRALADTQLSDRARSRVSQLSGGMFRRAGIAQAIVHQPSLLVLDEPTVGLDPEQRAWFHEVIARLGETSAVLLSTHLLEDVDALADRVVVMDQGEVRFTGTTDDLRARSESTGASAHEALRSGFLAVVGTSGAVA